MPNVLQPSGPYTWDAAIAQYRDGAGYPVPAASVRWAVEQVIAGTQAEIRGHCARLAGGALTLPEWQLHMTDTIRALHTAVAAAGKGGWAQMTPADWGRVGALTKQQYGYLADFAGALAGGQVDMQSAGFGQRAQSYADAGRATYEAAARLAADAAPALTQERNHLGHADHCPDCLAATAAGWVPIGTLVPPGARRCKTHCQCALEYQ